MIRIAQVVKVNPAARSVDLVFLDDGMRMANVRVMGGASDSGGWDVPSVQPPASERAAGGRATNGRTLHAVFAPDRHGRGVVMGFLAPGQGLAVREQDRMLYRHPSGAHLSIAPDGSIQLGHPGGTSIRIGTGGTEDVGAAAAGGWQAPSGAVPQVTLATADGVTITIKPGGEVELVTPAELKMTYGHATLTGDIALNGTLTATVDVVANGTSLHTHKHGGVTAGAAQTGVPA